MTQRRVVVTGLGALTPLGNTVQDSWRGVCEGKPGIHRITRFDVSNFGSRMAGEVKGFDPAGFLSSKEIRRMDLVVQYAVAASLMAKEDSTLQIAKQNEHRVGVIIGSGIGGIGTIEANHTVLLQKGPRSLSPFFIPYGIVNMGAGQVSIVIGAKGPNSCVSTACATGAHSIGDSFRMIQHDYADVMFAGGTEASITPLAVGGFAAMRALSQRNDDPERACRPFDQDRDGFVMGEGVGIVMLEELESAKARGAHIYAELVGYALNGDASHITHPAPGGEGAAYCMKLALQDARISPSDIDYINAHGTSTPAGDISETCAIKSVFGSHAKNVSVSSTKSMTGHLLGAAGGVEAIFSVLALESGVIPPTINLEKPDPQCDLDYTPNIKKRKKLKYALSNSFGFGGTNACLIFRRWDG